jgi:hypothetical protein
MRKYFVLLIILIIAISVVAINAKTIYTILDSEGNIIGAIDKEFLSQEQIEQGFTIEILFSSEPKSPELIKAEKAIKQVQDEIKEMQQDQQNKPKADINVQDWTNRISPTGSYIYIEGIVKNTGKGTAYYVQMKVQGLDKNSKLVALETGYAHPSTIPPNGTATFSISMQNYENIDKFKLGSQWDNKG